MGFFRRWMEHPWKSCNPSCSPATRAAVQVRAVDIHMAGECISENKLNLPKSQPICSPSRFGSGTTAVTTPKQVFNKLWTKKNPQIKYGRPADTVDTMRM